MLLLSSTFIFINKLKIENKRDKIDTISYCLVLKEKTKSKNAKYIEVNEKRARDGENLYEKERKQIDTMTMTNNHHVSVIILECPRSRPGKVVAFCSAPSARHTSPS